MEQTKVKFGLDQITAKTPDIAKWVFRVVLYLAAFANMIVDYVVDIPPHYQLVILKISGLAVVLVHGASKLFGVNVEDVPNYK